MLCWPTEVIMPSAPKRRFLKMALRLEKIFTPRRALSQVVLRYQNGVALRIADVANVAIGPAPAVGAASIDGKPAVSLMVESQYGAT